MKNSWNFLILICSLLLMTQQIVAQENFDDYSDEALQRYEALKKGLEGLNEREANRPPVSGYGRVLDQNGDPVPDANVKVDWSVYEAKPAGLSIIVDGKWVKADGNGFFSFTVERAHEPSIEEVKRRGYEFKRNLSPYFQAGLNEQNAMMANSKNEPIIIYMRKLNPTTFLLKDDLGASFEGQTGFMRYTIFDNRLRTIDRDLSKLKDPYQIDLIFDLSRNSDGDFTVRIIPPAGNGGLQLLDEYLYAAPAEGYSREVSINIPIDRNTITKYLYFTSRNPAVYSRLKLDMTGLPSDNALRIYGEVWTNPYAKRNLEYEPDMPIDLFIKLRDEAEKALKNGKLPPEPDLQALINSGQYN